jgi:hypothetical protein
MIENDGMDDASGGSRILEGGSTFFQREGLWSAKNIF